ncbi:transglutaminase domain-containing protein [Lujinxingia vulgaris]|uniref:Transglutaminase domain-containing protein n=1 Tax=Lujinxingia vulgaris TaxID=2600176 RepID=A0A5C6XDP7_9DELT|nr:transglutaminase-like domain-containing protein [Lujinxingia vulgaris]TXD38588.1 transglutaminase domain-containing protein [Lujinxingia vulgaris]
MRRDKAQRWRWRIRGTAAAVVLALPALLWAQESRRGDQVLHRHLDAQRFEAVSESDDGVSVASGQQAGAGPSPWEGQGQPGLSVEAGAQEWFWTADGPVAPSPLEAPHGGLDPATGSATLDTNTDRVSALNYQASFEPSVVPWKRGVAHDGVVRQGDGIYSTRRVSSSLRTVRVGGASAGAGEDRFWGSFLVRMEAGRAHPIPSVAPGQRVVQVLAEPLVDVEVLRDGADNFYLRGDVDGVVRVNMELAVDAFYFDGVLDEDVSWERFAPPERVLPDAEARAVAARVLGTRGIDRGLSPGEALNALVGYYRDFEARPFPQDEVGGDRYEAISTLQVGVCRHRALAFLVSAGSLGIESRYVYNEAHAFVEVRWPGQGWRRIDLGGAADGFNYQNMGANSVHRGGERDGFPQPQRYLDEIIALEGGDSSGALGEAAGGDVSDEGANTPSDAASSEASTATPGTPEAQRASPPENMQEARPMEAALPPIEILEASGQVMRGASLRVRGRVQRGDAQRVEVLLVPAGSDGFERGVALGEAAVRASGEFVGEWTVPRRVTLGRWVIKARQVPR